VSVTRSLPERIHERIAVLRAMMRPDPPIPMRRWLRSHWLRLSVLYSAALGVITLDVWLGTCGFAGCPTKAEIRAFQPSEGGRILDRNGKFIGHLAVVRRINVPVATVPRHVQAAFVAIEDRRFFDHNGLDWRGFGRAVIRNATSLGVREGFSTITMQVAHNSFLTDRYNGRSLRRKLIELRLSRLLERELTKDQILEHYLNVIYLGNGVNGIEAASRDLFGKSVNKLTVAEGAMLAALPKAPSKYTPRRNPQLAVQRRNLVLDVMVASGYLAQSAASAAKAALLRIAENEWRPSVADEPSALDAVRAIVDSVMPDVLKEGDVTIQTTLDFSLQRSADRHVLRHAGAITRETQESFGRVAEAAQGAYIALDPASGDIRALVPGRRTQRGGFNRAFQARRQPGSAFKPFVYAAAIAAGYSPGAEVDDEPVEVTMGRTVWTPANYNDQYQGRVTLRAALMHSSNAATVRVSRAIGEGSVIMAARRNGISSPLPQVPSIALGAVEVTPVELVAAYAPFGNGGRRVMPRLVRRIEAPDGTVLWAKDIMTAPAMDPQDAYEITSMLRGVVDYGTGRALRDWGVTGPVAGKTGTTNDGQDVWFVGYTPTLVAGVWFGYDTPRPISYNPSGGRLAAPAWAEIYLNGWREPRGAVGWTHPEGMQPAQIDPQSGELATEWCPTKQIEWFKVGQTPAEECHMHTGMPEQIAGDVTGQGRPGHRNPIDQLGREIGKTIRRIFRF
jgi:penicillin-binding protein 1A